MNLAGSLVFSEYNMSDIYRNILQNVRAVRRSQAAVNDILDD